MSAVSESRFPCTNAPTVVSSSRRTACLEKIPAATSLLDLSLWALERIAMVKSFSGDPLPTLESVISEHSYDLYLKVLNQIRYDSDPEYNKLIDRMPNKKHQTLFEYAKSLHHKFVNERAKTRAHVLGLDRFSNVLPVEDTMVTLCGLGMNANHISLLKNASFIATQAPHMPHQELGDAREALFWICLIQKNASAVFNLTSASEKCRHYAATQEQTRLERSSFATDNFVEEDVSNEHFTSSIHEIDYDNQRKHRYKYIEANNWNDGASTTLVCLKNLVEHQENIRKTNVENPIIVHCRAGVGRTGTFIVACALKTLADLRLLNRENYQTLILALVLSIRRQRSALAVQTEVQMELLVNYARDLVGLIQ